MGDLNAVRDASVYLGLMNSSMAPFVISTFSSHESRLMMIWLMFPGYGEYPVSGSFASPSLCPEAFSSGARRTKRSIVTQCWDCKR